MVTSNLKILCTKKCSFSAICSFQQNWKWKFKPSQHGEKNKSAAVHGKIQIPRKNLQISNEDIMLKMLQYIVKGRCISNERRKIQLLTMYIFAGCFFCHWQCSVCVVFYLKLWFKMRNVGKGSLLFACLLVCLFEWIKWAY